MTGDNSRPPFARHGTYYLVLKLAVLAGAALLAARLIGLW